VNGNHLNDVSYEFVDYPSYKGICDYNEYLIAPGHGTYKVKFTKGDLEATVTLESHSKPFAGTVVTLRENFGKNKPPIANAYGPYSANINEPVQFCGSGTDLDGDAIIAYAWDFDNDGITDSTLQNPTHSWAIAGTYYPTLKVKDERGAWSKPDECTVLIIEAYDYDGKIISVSSDPYFSTDKPVIIGVDIKNTGSIDETYKLNLEVYKDSETIYDNTIEDIHLSSGGTTSEEFSISGLSLGSYSFTLNLENSNYAFYDSAHGEFKVINKTAIFMLEDDANSLKRVAFNELDQMVDIVTDTTHEMIQDATWTLISGPIKKKILGLFSSDILKIEGVAEQDVDVAAPLIVTEIFDTMGNVVEEFGEKSLELKQGLYNAFRKGYTEPEEFKIIQRDKDFEEFVENRPLERSDKVIQLFKYGEAAVSNIVESRPWFVIGPFDINGPLPGGEVSYKITLQEERNRYNDVKKVSWVLPILQIIIAIIVLIAVALAAIGTSGAVLAALPGILGPLKTILTGLTLLSKCALVSLMVAMLLTVPHIAPEVTQEHDATLDFIEALVSQQAPSAKVTSIKTIERSIEFGRPTGLSIELNEETTEKIIGLVVSPDGRVIDIKPYQPYNTKHILGSIKLPHHPGKYKMFAMTHDDMMKSSIAEIEVEQVSPQITTTIYTDRHFYNCSETVVVFANFTNPLNVSVDNLMYSIDVLNTTYNKTGFLSLNPESSKIETLSITPEENGTYKVRSTIFAGLYEVDSAETGFTVENGLGVAVNVEYQEISDPSANVTANLSIKNIGTIDYEGDIEIKTVNELKGYEEVYTSVESIYLNESEEKKKGYLILPEESAKPGIYRTYLVIDDTPYILSFTVRAEGTIFITAKTEKVVYSKPENVNVNISVMDVAFNCTSAEINLTLIDPNGNKSYFDVTGANGSYSAVIPPYKKSINGTYFVFVTGNKEDYRVYDDKTFFVVNERTKLKSEIPANVKLNTIDNLNFLIKSDKGLPIGNSFVTLTGCGFNETKMTDDDGRVIFSAKYLNETGKIEVKIEKGGYSSFFKEIEVIGEEENIFDTGAPSNPYPSIAGTHTGTITPNRTITVNKLYTYPCAGTGGHTESIELYDENGNLIASGNWNGYQQGDWHNITFDNPVVLLP
ncbi:PKD domain-containing protein, partial [Methanophagales archaeon]